MNQAPGSRGRERSTGSASSRQGVSGEARRAASRPARAKGSPRGGSSGSAPWGELWLEAFAKMPGVSPGRIERGKAYACEGHVRQVRFDLGKIAGQVQGSRPKPYEVSVQVAPLDEATWDRAIKAIRRREALAIALQSGELPPQIERIFRSLGVSLLPSRETDLLSRCSCPDWASSCKHVAALHHALADALTRDPLRLFELRGRPREQVIRELRRARSPGPKRAPKRRRTGSSSRPLADARSAAAPARAAEGDYDHRSDDLGAMRFQFEPQGEHGAILKPLGDPPSWTKAAPIHSWLEPTYQAASDLAHDIALTETASLPPAEDPTPKPRP